MLVVAYTETFDKLYKIDDAEIDSVSVIVGKSELVIYADGSILDSRTNEWVRTKDV